VIASSADAVAGGGGEPAGTQYWPETPKARIQQQDSKRKGRNRTAISATSGRRRLVPALVKPRPTAAGMLITSASSKPSSVR